METPELIKEAEKVAEGVKKRIPWRLIIEIILAILFLLAVASAWYNWRQPEKVIKSVGYQPVPVEKSVEKIKRVIVPGPERIVTIEKKAVADKLDMPWLLDGGKPAPVAGKPEELQVTANANLAASRSGYSAVAVTNTTTGETTIVAKEKPLPFIGFPNEKELSIRYGLSTQDGQAANLAARWTFARVDRVYISAYGEVDAPRIEAKAMVEASCRF